MSYTELTHTTPKGRKGYPCDWCSERILKGEKHHYRSYVWDGDFNTSRTHNECDDVMSKMDLSEGYDPGQFKRGTDEER